MRSSHPIFRYCTDRMHAAKFETQIQDLGDGQVYLLAKRGNPKILLNCHLDTVSANPNWTRNPFTMETDATNGRVYGLGACDIKGAAACYLAAIESSQSDVAVLFNTDEESGYGLCIDHFLKNHKAGIELVVVAEPTLSRAVKRHRGFASLELLFSGKAAHTSMDGSDIKSASHDAIRWSSKALALTEPGRALSESRFNIGVIEGGTDANVVNAKTKVHCSMRPLPGQNGEELTRTLESCLPAEANVSVKEKYIAPPLESFEETEAFLEKVGIEAGPDVDFWTEAALFSDAGLPTFVLGPGSISQAHQADEWVEIEQLEKAYQAYMTVLKTDMLESTNAS